MRRFLMALIAVEALALIALGAGAALGAFDDVKPDRPPPPVFRPAIYSAVIGDMVRYERRARTEDGQDGELLGYLEYIVKTAAEVKNSTRGREFILELRELDARGRRLSTRLVAALPRTLAHGFLPPKFEEGDDYPVGERPVIARIENEEFTWRNRTRRGFRLDIVLPRRALTEPVERMWVDDETAVFGVVRWERKRDVLILHTQERHS